MSFVAPAFEPFEKAAHSRPSIFVELAPTALSGFGFFAFNLGARFALDQPVTFLLSHLPERRRGANLSPTRQLQHPLAHLAIRGCAPRRDESLAHREIRIRDHFFQIELDGTSEALAFGARADRAIG